ncbi:MAG: response regulator transcription factor [Desulfobacterales bacterium]|nr:response regulator transcription factor [Desulfobacterales bacterium]
MSKVTAIVADAEKLSLEHIKTKLDENWPDIVISGTASNGYDALKLIEKLQPDIAFLDVKLPGLSGIEVAQKILNTCKIVFITVFDNYAVNAFENEAIDYIIKPVSTKRLIKTIERIKLQLSQNFIQSNLPLIYEKVQANMSGLEQVLPKYLTWIKAAVKGSVRIIPVDQIHYFQSSNKYTMVITEEMEAQIKKSIPQLANELDPDMFFQIHRTTIVNASFIEKVSTSPTKRTLLKLKGRPEIHTVSRKFESVFKQM